MDEIWKDIQDWPFHQVSNKGRVRVLPGGKVRYRPIVETELRELILTEYGYIIVYRGSRSVRVHRIVLETFWGPCPTGQECRHLNGDRSDNRWPENIEWNTPKINQEDRIRHGTDNRGERHPGAKLTDADITNIRRGPGSSRELAALYGVSHTQILYIRRGKNWKHI